MILPHESLAERIANSVLDQFDRLPGKCKPRLYPDGRREWNTLCGIAVVTGAVDDVDDDDDDGGEELKSGIEERRKREVKVISIATGTKCLPASHISKCSGLVLHDSHAEVLALRGLNRWVLNEIKAQLTTPGYKSIFIDTNFLTIPPPSQSPSSSRSTTERITNTRTTNTPIYPFRTRKSASLYLFTTTAPCGDASMELLISSKHPSDSEPWTNQPNPDPKSGNLGRGHFDVLGAVRRKPGRGDVEATMSKSCTDKLTIRQFTGVLGFPVDLFVDPRSEYGSKRLEEGGSGGYLDGIITYADQVSTVGYERAFGREGRCKDVIQNNATEREETSSPTRLENHTTKEDTVKIHAKFFDVLPLPSDFRRFEYEKPKQTGSNMEDQKATKVGNVSALWIAGPSPTPQTIPSTSTTSTTSATMNGDGRKSNAEVVEVLVNGVKQGFKQFDPKTSKGSVICRRNMWELALEIDDLLATHPSSSPLFSTSSSSSPSILSSPSEEKTDHKEEGGKERVSVNHNHETKQNRELEIKSGVETYYKAKTSEHRKWKVHTKSIVTSKLGGWISNSRDDDFSLTPST